MSTINTPLWTAEEEHFILIYFRVWFESSCCNYIYLDDWFNHPFWNDILLNQVNFLKDIEKDDMIHSSSLISLSNQVQKPKDGRGGGKSVILYPSVGLVTWKELKDDDVDRPTSVSMTSTTNRPTFQSLGRRLEMASVGKAHNRTRGCYCCCYCSFLKRWLWLQLLVVSTMYRVTKASRLAI